LEQWIFGEISPQKDIFCAVFCKKIGSLGRFVPIKGVIIFEKNPGQSYNNPTQEMEVIMPIRKRNFWGVVLGTILLLWAGLAQAAEFTATMITKAGGMEIPGKVYVKGDKMRNEIAAAGHTSIHIMRPDKKLVWIILPQQKAYMEMPISQEAQQKMMTLTEKQKAKMTKVGTETIDGYNCDKYETTMDHQGKPMKVYTWIATDLGIPIKIVSQDGSFSMEYKDIKTGQVADSLFEAPQGYQKMKMPFAMPPAK
jgi:hypothetical protein